MSDMIMAVVALVTMIVFLSVLAVWVPSVDLILVIVLVGGLTAYDFWRLLREKNGK